MKLTKTSGLISCIVVSLLLAGSLAIAEDEEEYGAYGQERDTETVKVANPTIRFNSGTEYRIAFCFNLGKNCGQVAADAYCRNFPVPYKKAVAFQIEYGTGARMPTWNMGDKRLCNQPPCDGFAYITCTDSD